MPTLQQAVEIFDWNDGGYRPLVFSDDWQVAVLNWVPDYNPGEQGQIERHEATDEVFVLWRGKGALYVLADDSIRVIDMVPGAAYNVTRGTWHGIVATPDASWIIVEKRDTHVNGTEVRALTGDELTQLKAQYPDWMP